MQDYAEELQPMPIEIEPVNKKTCATCKHWDALTARRHGVCDGVPHNISIPPEADCLASPAYTEDGERYSSALFTLPTFSCSLHAVRSVPVDPPTG